MTDPKPPTILIVDDDPALQKLVVALLERSGMMPYSAMSAKEAAQILRDGEDLPDLMLLDLMLPEISGIEFLKQLRAKVQFQTMPVIILSALADPDQIREGLEAGANRYLTKPYLANNLVKTIGEVLTAQGGNT